MLFVRYRLDGGLPAAPEPLSPPEPHEVVVQVAGIALGVEPAAELSGVVVETGESAAEWRGRRVVVPRCLPCGDCERCRRGRTTHCAGRARRELLADHVVVPARYLCSVEPPLWPEAAEPAAELWQLAALADAAAAPYGALVRAGLGPGELLVIIGGGIRGAFAVSLARSLGAHPAVVESDPARAERARALGALCLVSADRSPDEARAEIEAAGAPLGLPDHGYKILETTGSAAGRHRALTMLPDGGTAALLEGDGAPGPAVPPSDLEPLARREAQLLGASACHPDLYPELCARLSRGELPLATLTCAVAPEEAAAALAARREGRLLPLPIVRPPGSW